MVIDVQPMSETQVEARAAVTVIVPESTEVRTPEMAWMAAEPDAWPVNVALFASAEGTRSAVTTPPLIPLSDQVAATFATNVPLPSRLIA